MNKNEWMAHIKEQRQQSEAKGMCPECDPDSDLNTIYQDSLTGDWYLELQTSEWDNYNDDFVYLKEYINYCPYCGRKLPD